MMLIPMPQFTAIIHNSNDSQQFFLYRKRLQIHILHTTKNPGEKFRDSLICFQRLIFVKNARTGLSAFRGFTPSGTSGFPQDNAISSTCCMVLT